jgi:hypothetical protein
MATIRRASRSTTDGWRGRGVATRNLSLARCRLGRLFPWKVATTVVEACDHHRDQRGCGGLVITVNHRRHYGLSPLCRVRRRFPRVDSLSDLPTQPAAVPYAKAAPHALQVGSLRKRPILALSADQAASTHPVGWALVVLREPIDLRMLSAGGVGLPSGPLEEA